MERYFCTYFDKNYLIRGLALYDSLKRHCAKFNLWVLCMDKETYSILNSMKLSNIELISIEEFEHEDKALQEVKKNRSQIEYYFTCTPSLPLFVLKKFSEVDLITYIDADLYFFSNPDIVYDEIKNYSIAIIRHNFSSQNRTADIAGIYNVSWLSFRRDENGLSCLNWWREACNECCLDRVEGNRFADQRYLDDWPTRFKNVTVLQNKGIDVAPWNAGNYNIHIDKDKIWINEQLLVFFHFHDFRHLIGQFYYTGLSYYKVKVNDTMRHFIYNPYLKMLLSIKRSLLHSGSNFYPLKSIRTLNRLPLQKKVYIKIKQFISMIYRIIVFSDYIMASWDW